MVNIVTELDGGQLRQWMLEGFPDETVLVVPIGGQLFEVGVRVMEEPHWCRPTEPARAATLDEVAEVAAYITKTSMGREEVEP